VIPCYRDEQQLHAILDQLGPVLDGVQGGAELVLVDDGSPDRTGIRALQLAPRWGRRITVVRLARNFGQHPAVFAGLAAARGQIVVVTDSDLQYPPSQILRLANAVSDDWPVVSGYREDRKDPLARRIITGMLTRWLSKRTGQTLTDYGSMFRAYDRAVVDAMTQLTERHRYVPAIPSWMGFQVLELPVEHRSRGELGTRYRMSSLVALFLDLITSYSISPLRAISLVAACGALLGFIATVCFAIYRVAFGSGHAGVVSAFALVFALLAVQLLSTALLGEYIGRIYVETRERPYFVVRSTDHFDGSGAHVRAAESAAAAAADESGVLA
jgi:undecaprenyl-phosphate 4-deoxy-4-formamido-L-arabinose transferase